MFNIQVSIFNIQFLSDSYPEPSTRDLLLVFSLQPGGATGALFWCHIRDVPQDVLLHLAYAHGKVNRLPLVAAANAQGDLVAGGSGGKVGREGTTDRRAIHLFEHVASEQARFGSIASGINGVDDRSVVGVQGAKTRIGNQS